MVVFDVLFVPVGYKGDKMRLFLTDEGYESVGESGTRLYQAKEPCQGTQPWLFKLRP